MSTDSTPLPTATESTEQSDPPLRQVVTVHLQKIPLLANVDTETLTQVAAALQIRSVDRGQHVLHKGGMGDHLLFLLSGRLQAVDLTEDGREIGLSFLTPGDYFGELSIIDGLPRSASVLACETSLVAFLPRAQALVLIYQNPLVAERLLKRMASTIRTAANYRTILGIPNAFQRVFALLNQFAKIAPGGLVVIEKMPTQQEIAIMVNTSRETVSRAIHILIQKGVVEKDMRRLIVRQPEALRKVAATEAGSIDK
jgi:CRP/FNR family cyclic AMP-dependent transcriptional regulator